MMSTIGRIGSTTSSMGLIPSVVTPHRIEYPIDRNPHTKRVFYKDLKSSLSAIEQACGSFLYQARYEIDTDLLRAGRLFIRVKFYKRVFGSPNISDTIDIYFDGKDRYNLKFEYDRFKFEVEAVTRHKGGDFFNKYCKEVAPEKIYNILIRKEVLDE